MPSQILKSTMAASLKRPRPKGLWRARATTSPNRPAQVFQDSDTEYDNDDLESIDTRSTTSKRSRRESSTEPADDDEAVYFDYSRQCSPERESCWTRRTRIMDTTSTARRGGQTEARTTCDYEDWQDLKDLFNKAAQRYENDDAADALPILRGVVHECHRFLIYYQDPSILFSTHPRPHGRRASDVSPLTQRPNFRRAESDFSRPIKPFKACTCVELPTAFHAILGTALFLFGNLIAQDASLALADEPDTPTPYWLAALDVFETGENLPSRTSGTGCEAPEDWRMAIVWGRTLVCIADETILRSKKEREQDHSALSHSALSHSALSHSAHPSPSPFPSSSFPVAQFTDSVSKWPKDSPFAAIAARRPPVTRRMPLMSASPNDLMVLAMDQFSRGIFHMPHPQHSPSYHHAPHPNANANSLTTGAPSSTSKSTPSAAPPLHESFSRAKELFTIAAEVLLLAEKMDGPAEREYWASWADSVFNQMKMEADMDAWRVPINRARGRCWLIVGSARAEECEEALERGEVGVLGSEAAEDAREGLGMAVTFFERAKGSAKAGAGRVGGEERERGELRALLAEALLTLANLTPDEGRREELYARAQVEGGVGVLLDDRMVVE